MTVSDLEGLRNWDSRADHASLLQFLTNEHPAYLPLKMEGIKAAQEIKDAKETPDMEAQRQKDIVLAVDALVAAVDTDAIAMYQGKRVDPDDIAAQEKGKEYDKAKGFLHRQAKVRCDRADVLHRLHN